MKQSRIIQIVIIAANLALVIVCLAAYCSEDRVKPEFMFQTSDYIYQESEQTDTLLRDIMAKDDRDGDITERIVIEKVTENRAGSTIVVYYAVSDSAGNVSKISRVFPARFDETVHGEAAEAFGKAQTSPVETLENDAAREQSKEKEKDDAAGNEDRGDSTETQKDEIDGEEEDSRNAAAEHAEETGREDEDAPDREEEEQNETEDIENGREGVDEEMDHPQEQEPEPQEAQNEPVNSAPILTLKKQEVTIDAGTSPPWTEIIETLRDDKDDYTTLYYNLSVGRFNRNQPGDYPVTLYTEDSDGNRSDTVTVIVHVKGNTEN